MGGPNGSSRNYQATKLQVMMVAHCALCLLQSMVEQEARLLNRQQRHKESQTLQKITQQESSDLQASTEQQKDKQRQAAVDAVQASVRKKEFAVPIIARLVDGS